MLAAGLVKHNLLPIPLAVSVWLFFYDRARFWLWLVVCVAGAIAVSAVIWKLHGWLVLKINFFSEAAISVNPVC